MTHSLNTYGRRKRTLTRQEIGDLQILHEPRNKSLSDYIYTKNIVKPDPTTYRLDTDIASIDHITKSDPTTSGLDRSDEDIASIAKSAINKPDSIAGIQNIPVQSTFQQTTYNIGKPCYTRCTICDLFYNQTLPSDISLHKQYHNKIFRINKRLLIYKTNYIINIKTHILDINTNNIKDLDMLFKFINNQLGDINNNEWFYILYIENYRIESVVYYRMINNNIKTILIGRIWISKERNKNVIKDEILSFIKYKYGNIEIVDNSSQIHY
eukprot:GHVP01021428.1.p1 GENE.GHVP01021428.1~~GHVP01021428.1.p1  ORF type:complete len:268 (-),score=17.91 GHVP01021428.1:352-1155(-)